MIDNSGPHVRRLRELEEENELLRYRIEQFEESFGVRDDLAPLTALGFSPSEARILNLLHRREFTTRRQMVLAIYATNPDRASEMPLNVASVFMSRVRSKLARFGITLHQNRPWGDGLHRYLSPQDRANLKRLIESSRAALIERSLKAA